jgi:hypothetical protein
VSTENETPDDAPVRASGATPAVEEAHDVAVTLNEQLGIHNTGEDIDRTHREPRFARMRFNWKDPEQVRTVNEAHRMVDHTMVREFMDAYQIIDEIQHIVRIPVLDADGDALIDEHGEPHWERTPGGRIIEDYSRLSRAQQEAYLGQITTRLFGWEQTAERMWMDAMMARGMFEEQFAISYDNLRGSASRTTVDDRKAYGNMEASLDRYFAIFQTSLSRRAQALCKSMERIGQRLKDVLVA